MSNHTKDGTFDKPDNFLYHPYELFFSGFSGSGKTTLLTQVIEKLSSEYEIGCVKHCSHRYEFDLEGKDSWKLHKAGAQAVILNAPGKWTSHNQGDLGKFDRPSKLASMDFVLAEGAKEHSGKKIVVLDPELKILELIEKGEVEEVIAIAGEKQPDNCLGLPFFHRNDIETISSFVIEQLKAKTPKLKALLLTGGKSTRMGEDKSLLKYNGEPQINRIHHYIKQVVDDVFISCKNKNSYPGFDEDKYIEDRYHGLGPMGGILSAMTMDAKSAWLIVAVDLPFVNEKILNILTQARNPFKIATAFKSNFQNFPEPLCTIYEPSARYSLFKFLGLGYSCPRKVLINSPVHILDQGEPNWLDNANTPEEYEEICRVLSQ
jgi:molybdenum cofactor guanylyltransferase